LIVVGFIFAGIALYRSWKTSPQVKIEKLDSKLKIHRAVYGTGWANDIDVTDALKSTVRDGLVIDVDNNLVPRDPAPNIPKRLHVEYSYESGNKVDVNRPESSQSYRSRLVLPEDSEIARLSRELGTVFEKHRALEAQVNGMKAEQEQEKIVLRWPSLVCGNLRSSGLANSNDVFFRAVVPVTNNERRYESIAHRVRAVIRLRHKASGKEVIVDPATWHSFSNGAHSFSIEVSLGMGDQRELVIFEWLIAKTPRQFIAGEKTQYQLDYGEWDIHVRLTGDNFVGDFEIPPVTLTPTGGTPGCA
jgi:hypothetical protein